MGRFDGYLLCSDYDGTFSLPDGSLSAENLEAVSEFQRQGGLFTIASGRSSDFIIEKEGFSVNAPLIVMNGTMICDPTNGTILKSWPLDDGILDAADELAASGLTDTIVFGGDTSHRCQWNRDMSEAPGEYFSGLRRKNELTVLYKAIFVQSAERTLKLRQYCLDHMTGRYSFDRSWAEGLELHAIGSGKGAGLRWLKAYYGSRIRTTVGIGDYENDISLIRDADIGYAVANALEEVRLAADRVTVDYRQHAIAAVIGELAAEDR